MTDPAAFPALPERNETARVEAFSDGVLAIVVTLLMLNLQLLLMTCVVPFPAAVVSEYLGGPGAQTATLVLGGVFVVTAVVFNVLWRYASRDRRLIAAHIPQEVVDAQTRQYRFGPIVYLVAFLLAFISPTLSVAVNLAIAVFFALPLGAGASG